MIRAKPGTGRELTANMMRHSLLVLVALLFLAGCKTDLYSNITEREANQMMAALMQNGIVASKTPVRDGLFTLQVDSSDIASALTVLDRNGLPQRNRQSIGQVFQRSGMISSPFEERVRYVFALGEEVAQTIQQIDGILEARVHIVMPEEPALGQQARPSSAAVFIRQQAGYDLEFLTPQIRRLVSSSIEGVEYEAVTVVLVEAQPAAIAAAATSDYQTPIPGISVRSSSVTPFWSLVGGLVAACLLFMATTVALALRNRRGRRDASDNDGEAA